MSKGGEYWEGHDDAGSRPGGGDAVQDPEEFYTAGIFLVKRDRVKEALSAFRQALEIKKDEPRYLSYFGYCLAKAEGRTKEGAALCERAVQKEFYRVELFINLGRVYLLAGNRKKAHMAFRKGLALDRENREIRGELDRMGIRRPPVLPFLDRKNPVNKLAGKVLFKLRLR